MKITSLISASAMALALAAPVYAQTAPATPAPTTAAPTTPAPTTAAPTTPAPTTAAPATPAPTTAAPTTPAPATPAPATPAPTTAAPTGIPAAFTNVPAVQQVDAQLAAQGYTITDVVQNANGSYSILSKSPSGQLRLITVNPATGGVSDTVTAGVAAGTNGAPMVNPEGTFEHEANESDAMEAMESDDDGGRESDSNEGSNDSGEGHDDGESDGEGSDD